MSVDNVALYSCGSPAVVILSSREAAVRDAAGGCPSVTLLDIFDYSNCDPKVSLETFRQLRENNLRMLKALPKDLWQNYGMHEERGKESISHLVGMFAGHDLNHLAQIEKIAKSSETKRKRAA